MKTPEVATVDFETFPIQQRPHYPPRPVGVAIGTPWMEKPAYITRADEARTALGRVWDSGLPVLCHHAKFDLAVATEQLELPMLPWQRIHDTMFLSYLYEPHARSLGLKELAASLLRWPAEERDALSLWILSHKAQLEAAYPQYGSVTKKTVGAWIFAAPPELVAPYAIGDVTRTQGLFSHLWPIIQNEGMGGAYDRERQLLPILMENEREGMCADVETLELDISAYSAAFSYVEDRLRAKLKASQLNFDADADVANVLLTRGIVPKENWVLTPSGQMSVSKENLLPSAFTGPDGAAIASALGYRNRLQTCLAMFMRPWLAQARENGGRITTNWNQVRNPSDGGTRTGRPSTDKHNFLNISKAFEGRDDGYQHPEFLDVPRLPLCRKYVLPDPGHVFLHRDFDGQELRVFAHLEQGDLWHAYQANPNLDPHAFVGEAAQKILDSLYGPGVRILERTKIKTLNFQGLYGGGAPAAARKLRCSLKEAREFKAIHDKALPGRKYLNEQILKIVRGEGRAIRTWGGRLYRPEKPRVVDGEMRTWEYKLINYAVQGSAADLTKQALIDWYPGRGASRFLVTVYDEINISAPVDDAEASRAMDWLKHCMNAPRLTVPMTSAPKHGASWGAANKCPPEKDCPLCA